MNVKFTDDDTDTISANFNLHGVTKRITFELGKLAKGKVYEAATVLMLRAK